MIDILGFISMIRNSFVGSTTVYTMGSCVHFAFILKSLYGGVPVWSEKEEHALLLLDDEHYDIEGKYTGDTSSYDAEITDIDGLGDKYNFKWAGIECSKCEELFVIQEILPEIK